MIVREGMAMGTIGVTAGAYPLAKLLAAVLYGVTPTDAASYASAAGFVLLLAWIASYLPARRAICMRRAG
jgi:putative ABC transport system permease protein